MEQKNQHLTRLSQLGEEEQAKLIELVGNLIKKESVLALDYDDQLKELQKVTERYTIEYQFKKNDIVRWKSGLKNKKIPQYGQPCMVIEVLEEAIYDKDAGVSSPYFREKLDIRLAVLDEDNDLLSFFYDQNRFELVAD